MKQEENQLKAGIILNYINMGIGNLIPVFYTPIMLSLLGQNEYGLYKLSSSVTSYLSLISMGLGAAITRYLIKASTEKGKEAEERMLGLFVTIFNIIAVVAVLVGFVLITNLHKWYGSSLTAAELGRMKILVFLMILNMALGFSISPYMSIVTSHEKFLFYQSMNIMLTCVGPILNLVVLFLGAASVGMAAVALGISIVTRVIYQFYITRKMSIKPRFKNLPVYQLREVLIFSFWVFLSNVVGQLYNTTDTVMIGMIPALATTGVAVYNVGIMLSNIIGGISTGISSLLTPTVNRMVLEGADGETLTTLAIQVGRLQGMIAALLVSGFVSFGKPFLYLYIGPEYEDAYWVALWVSIPAIIFLVQSVCLSIITAANKHQFRSVMYLFIAVLNVIGTWYMMKPWGIVGAAAMSGIATIIGQGFIMNWYYWKRTDLNMKRFWKEVIGILIVPACMVYGTKSVMPYFRIDNYFKLMLGASCYTAVYILLSWFLILKQDEKGRIRSWLSIKNKEKKRT